jgi:hypothetical protein
MIEGCFGMGGTLAIELVEERDLVRLRAGDPLLRKAVTELLDAEYNRAKQILVLRTDALKAVSETLIASRAMNVAEVRDLLRAHPTTESGFGVETDRHDQTVRTAPALRDLQAGYTEKKSMPRIGSRD